MSRLAGWVIAVVALGLVISLAFTGFDGYTNQWKSNEDGALTQVTVQCPAPVRVLFGAIPDGDPSEETCVKASRTLAFEAGVVALAAILIVWKPLTRPRPTRIDPISKKINRDGSGLPG